jgi:hypothetical protein
VRDPDPERTERIVARKREEAAAAEKEAASDGEVEDEDA